ncbi:MAG: metalloregulator ArsR/SmtB family transcription factor [Nitrosopumilus sp.]
MLEKAYKIFFGTLANKNRLKIINLLRKGTKCVHEICEELDFNQTTVSHNLKRMLRCGFVFVEKKGKYRCYSLNKKTIKPLMNLIDGHMHDYCEKIVQGKR